MKKFLLLLILTVSYALTGFAEESKFDFANSTYGLTAGNTYLSKNQSIENSDGFKITFNNTDANKANANVRMWTNGTIRMYAGSFLTISAPNNGTITSVQFKKGTTTSVNVGTGTATNTKLTNGLWSGSTSEPISFYNLASSGNIEISDITITYTPGSIGGGAKVAKPELTFTDEFDLTMSCSTEGNSIYYTTNGDEPTKTSKMYNGESIDLSDLGSGTYSINAVAYATIDGKEEASAVATGKVTVPTIISKLSDAYTITTGTTFLIKAPTSVFFVDKGGAYITDGSKNYYLYKSTTLTEGADFSRISTKCSVYNELPEGTNSVCKGGSVHVTVPSPRSVASINDITVNDWLFDVVSIEGVTIEGSGNSLTATLNDEEITLFVRDSNLNFTPEDGAYYNVTGIVARFGETVQVIPMTITKGVQVVKLGEIKVNGQEVSENEELNFKVGDKLTFSAANAETIMFSAEADNEENSAAGDEDANSVEWEITAADHYKINIMAGLGDDDKEVTFFVTVTEPLMKIDTFAWSEESVTITQGEEYELPTFSCSVEGLDIHYSSSNHGVATVADGVITLGDAVGEAIITASFDGNDQYEEAVATCKIIVKKAGVKVLGHTGMWEQITTEDELVDGEVYTIVGYDSNDNRYAMATNFSTSSASYLNKHDIEVEENVFESADNTAVVVINKVNGGYTLYLTNGVKGNDDAVGFFTCGGLTLTKNNKNNITVSEEASTDASIAEFTFNDNGTIEVKFKSSTESATESTRVFLCYNASNKAFSCYDKSTSGMNPIYLYRVHTPAPTNEASNGTVTITAANEQHNIWYRVKGGASAKEGMRRDAAAEQPFISADRHTVTLTLDPGQSVDYYSEYLGRKSATMNVDYAGNTTGIDEITSENDASIEWYDLSGRRVVAPSKGIFIKKHGNAVTKHMVK